MTGLEILGFALNSISPFLIKGSINEKTATYLRKNLDKIIPFFSSPIFNHIELPELKRVTINKHLFNGKHRRIYDVDHLKYPPREKVKKYGRANYIGQSILYATPSNPMTPLDEMKPNIGDLITVSTWNLKKDRSLSVSPVFKITSKDNLTHNELSIRFSMEYRNSLKQHPAEVAEQIDALLHFVAECFAKEVEYGNNYDYFLSAFFANKIFYELDNGSVEAILYPSVPNKLTFSNIAIKPEAFDSKYELVEVEESVVLIRPKPEMKGFYMRGTAWSNKIKDGKIIWQ